MSARQVAVLVRDRIEVLLSAIDVDPSLEGVVRDALWTAFEDLEREALDVDLPDPVGGGDVLFTAIDDLIGFLWVPVALVAGRCDMGQTVWSVAVRLFRPGLRSVDVPRGEALAVLVRECRVGPPVRDV